MGHIQQSFGSGVYQDFCRFVAEQGYAPASVSRYCTVLAGILKHPAISGSSWPVDPEVEQIELEKWAKGKPSSAKLVQLLKLDGLGAKQLVDTVCASFSPGYQRLVRPVFNLVYSWLQSRRGVSEASVPHFYARMPTYIPYLSQEQVCQGIADFSRDFQPGQLRAKLAIRLLYSVGVKADLMVRVARASYDDSNRVLAITEDGRTHRYQFDEATHITFMVVTSQRATFCHPASCVFSEPGFGAQHHVISWYARQFFCAVGCSEVKSSMSVPTTLWLLGAAHRIAANGWTEKAVTDEMNRHGLVSEEVRRLFIASSQYFKPSRPLGIPPQF